MILQSVANKQNVKSITGTKILGTIFSLVVLAQNFKLLSKHTLTIANGDYAYTSHCKYSCHFTCHWHQGQHMTEYEIHKKN